MRAIGVFVISISIWFVGAGSSLTPSAQSEKKTYVCSMHPEVQSGTEGKCPKCGMKLVLRQPQAPSKEQTVTPTPMEDQSAAPPAPPAQARTVETVKGTEEYFCTMHPEVRTKAAGKCPKCAMTLVPVTPAVAEDFNLKLEATPKAPKPGEKVRLRFSVINPKTGEQVKQFNLMHEKLYHLFIISQDLTEFQHIHPEHQSDGSFTIDTVLPRPGSYKIYSDIYPDSGAAQVLQQNIATAGYQSDLFAARPKLQPDTSLTKTGDGTKVELAIEPTTIIAGQPVTLKYRLTDLKSGEPVRDLVPYLGAWGHTLIISEDQQDYVHSHPEETVEDAEGKRKERGGPDVSFAAFMPRPGIYRIWTQFQRGETLSTYSFTVRAEHLR